MDFQDVDQAIARANAKKEIVGLPIRIVRQNKKLYLRGNFPSNPHSALQKSSANKA